MHGSPYPSVLKASACPPGYEAHCPDDQTSRTLHESVPEAVFSPCRFRCIGYSKGLYKQSECTEYSGLSFSFYEFCGKNKKYPLQIRLNDFFYKEKGVALMIKATLILF